MRPTTVSELSIVAAVAGVAALYFDGAARGRTPVWSRWCFGAGLAGVLVALVGPIDHAAHTSLPAHMAQHVLLMSVAAPLLGTGAPLPALAWALPARWRPAAVRRWRKAAAYQRGGAWIAIVGGALVVQAAGMAAWHVPAAYEMALRSPWAHAGEHLTLLVTSAAFWWALTAGHRARPGVVPVLFVAALPGTALGALMTLSSSAWYTSYPSVGGQQLAGVVMWAFGGVVYVLGAAVAFAAWLAAADRRAARVMARTGALAVVAALSFVACSSSGNGGASGARIVTGGDSNAGARLIRHYGCGNCHTIPGIRGADALVGPPLIHWARRTYIAGKLANTPENLETWVRQPREVEPGTDMPDLGVTTDESRNIAAYLMSQR